MLRKGPDVAALMGPYEGSSLPVGKGSSWSGRHSGKRSRMVRGQSRGENGAVEVCARVFGVILWCGPSLVHFSKRSVLRSYRRESSGGLQR